MLLGIGMGLVGTGFAARISDPTAAAFALGNHVFGMLFMLFRVVGAGVSVAITQSLGGGRQDIAARIACAVLGASTWIGMATAMAAAVLAVPLMQIMNTPAEVLPLAAGFLSMLAPALLLDAWFASMSSVLRANLQNKQALAVVFLSNATHLLLAWPLMFGFGPLPALGLYGYALAQIIGRLVALGANLMLWHRRLNIRPRWQDWFAIRRKSLAPVLRIGLPGAAETVAYRLAFMTSIASVGLLGTEALATQAYVLQISYLALIFGLATGLAVEIAVGHLIGGGHLHHAGRLVRRATGWGLIVSVAATTMTALLAPWTLSLFSRNEMIITTGTLLLWLTVLLEPGRTFNLIVINALRATGDARYPVVAGAASMMIVLAGGSWLLGVHFELGLVGVWIAYAADEWIRGLLMWRRWATLRWIPFARATHRRLLRVPRNG
jgi:putative MATE family efflux protein